MTALQVEAESARAQAQVAASRLTGMGVEERTGAATALATLALVAEVRALREAQETANLIAVYTADGAAGEALTSQANLTPGSWTRMAEQIKERLGL